jgi:sugar phosphate isomerase/epimerase
MHSTKVGVIGTGFIGPAHVEALRRLPGLLGIPAAYEWGRFVSALTDVRYDGPACIEVEGRAFEADLDSRKAAIEQSGRYLRQFIIG